MRSYPMHNKSQARYSLLLLRRDRNIGVIDEAIFQQAIDRLKARWPGGTEEDRINLDFRLFNFLSGK